MLNVPNNGRHFWGNLMRICAEDQTLSLFKRRLETQETIDALKLLITGIVYSNDKHGDRRHEKIPADTTNRKLASRFREVWDLWIPLIYEQRIGLRIFRPLLLVLTSYGRRMIRNTISKAFITSNYGLGLFFVFGIL